MKTVSINSVNYGSTGNIMLSIAAKARTMGNVAYTYSAPGRSMRHDIPGHRFIGTRLGHNLHLKLGYFTGLQGLFSIIDTLRFCKNVDKYMPDIIHLHNLHNSYVNLLLLFRYIKKHSIPVVWTLHDCWAMTGQCPYFTAVKCDKWKTGCFACPQYRNYPATMFDNSKTMWLLKKKWFTGVENMTIVTPSQWLADLVRQSYLKEYPVKVIHNGIDLSAFKPTPSDFREKHGIAPDQKMLLGVAFGWGKRKGLDVFIELAKHLTKDYKIVLVGTDDATDKQLPENIISIHRTQNQKELAEIYTAADLFVNPTREENYPTVNMEALACGTSVITFKTGGSPEIIDETCGSVVECDEVDVLEREIVYRCEVNPFSREACLKKAESFDMHKRFEEYVRMYEELR